MMNKKIFVSICALGFVLFYNFSIECKSRDVNEKTCLEHRIKESEESKIDSFFDPNIDEDIKIENAFENPSMFKVWIREIGIGLLCRYYNVKGWCKKSFGKIFSFVK